MIPNRLYKQNNPILPEYDEKLPTNLIMCLHCTNLYCTAMTSRLPISDLRWLQSNEKKETVFINVPDGNGSVFFLEVDLEHPQKLHDSNCDYTLASVRHSKSCCHCILGIVESEEEIYVKLYLTVGLVFNKICRVQTENVQTAMMTYLVYPL